MTVSELITAVGNENIQAQWLLDSLVKIDTLKNEGRITFATTPKKSMQLASAITFNDHTKVEQVCLILWLDKSKLPEGL